MPGLHRSRPARIPACLSLLAVLCCGGPAAAAGGVGTAGASWAADPVHVYWDGGDCAEPEIELEVFDRVIEEWDAHPHHPRVPVPSCQVEDAGYLLNELRWRCPGDEQVPPSAWFQFDAFDPDVMSRCAVGQIDPGARRTVISVDSPADGTRVTDPEPYVTLSGSVRVDGLDGNGYDVLLLIDRSTSARGLDAQVSAARSFVRRIAPRLGPVRLGVLSYPGDAPAAPSRRELDWSDDAAALDAALARLASAGVGTSSSAAAALDAATATLATARPTARPVVVLSIEGSRLDPPDSTARTKRVMKASVGVEDRGAALHWFAIGGVAGEAPPLVQRVLEHMRGGFRRVAPAAYGTAYLSGLVLPVVEQVWVEGRAPGSRTEAALEPSGRFRARVPLVAGTNSLLVRARTTDGAVVHQPLEVVFDDTRHVEKLLAEERERIRAAQRKQLDLRPERPAP